MRAYRPVRRLATIYNADEENSVVNIRQLQALSLAMDFELLAKPVPPGPDGQPDPASLSGLIEDFAARRAPVPLHRPGHVRRRLPRRHHPGGYPPLRPAFTGTELDYPPQLCDGRPGQPLRQRRPLHRLQGSPGPPGRRGSLVHSGRDPQALRLPRRLDAGRPSARLVSSRRTTELRGLVGRAQGLPEEHRFDGTVRPRQPPGRSTPTRRCAGVHHSAANASARVGQAVRITEKPLTSKSRARRSTGS